MEKNEENNGPVNQNMLSVKTRRLLPLFFCHAELFVIKWEKSEKENDIALVQVLLFFAIL